jgi:exocyst complex component 2
MADHGSAILNHYKIDNLFPNEWPDSKDAEDTSDDDGLLPAPKPPQRVTSRSRYSVLEPKRSSVPGAERSKEGVENLVQRDEPDPLGSSSSVIQTLRRQGVDIDADSKLSMSGKVVAIGQKLMIDSQGTDISFPQRRSLRLCFSRKFTRMQRQKT